MPPPTLHVFASVKGGVGKSTLAVTCARLLAARGRPSVVLDMDFTGTSLADGLDLRPPLLDEGLAPPTDPAEGAPEWLSTEETALRRSHRRDAQHAGAGRYLPYLNDLMTRHVPQEDTYPIERFLWRCDDDNVRYMPSSPFRADVEVAADWLHGDEGGYIHHVAWILDRLLRALPDLRDVVIDLPPGTVGFSHEVLALASTLDLRRPLPHGYPPWDSPQDAWAVNVFLVTSEDRNDHRPALDYTVHRAAALPSLRVLFNRGELSMQELRKITKKHFFEAGALGIEDRVRRVPNDPYTLGRIFRDPGRRDLAPAPRNALERALGLEA